MRKLFYIISIIAMTGIASPVFALTVSPARIEVTGDPGATLRGEIELFNEQEGKRTFFTSSENFEPSGDSGSPRFVGAKDGLATWIQSDATVALESGTRVKVPYSITIPKNAEPGGYFAAIFFGSQSPNLQGTGGEVSVGGKIGVLVLLRVSGTVNESGGLLDFVAQGQKGFSENFFTSLPIKFNYRFNNTGGDRVVPKGEIKIKNTFRLSSATLLANKSQGSVLPNSARKFEVMWGSEQETSVNKEQKVSVFSNFFSLAGKQWKDFYFGWYTAELSLSWGETIQTADATYNFFVVPWQLILIISILVFILVSFARIGIGKYNRFIISKAMQQQK